MQLESPEVRTFLLMRKLNGFFLFPCSSVHGDDFISRLVTLSLKGSYRSPPSHSVRKRKCISFPIFPDKTPEIPSDWPVVSKVEHADCKSRRAHSCAWEEVSMPSVPGPHEGEKDVNVRRRSCPPGPPHGGKDGAHWLKGGMLGEKWVWKENHMVSFSHVRVEGSIIFQWATSSGQIGT